MLLGRVQVDGAADITVAAPDSPEFDERQAEAALFHRELAGVGYYSGFADRKGARSPALLEPRPGLEVYDRKGREILDGRKLPRTLLQQRRELVDERAARR